MSRERNVVRVLSVTVVLVGVCAMMPGLLWAQDDTETQFGSLQCSGQIGNPGTCSITFAHTFGGQPSILVSPSPFYPVIPESITPAGFSVGGLPNTLGSCNSPVPGVCAALGAPASLSGSWIAAGPRLHLGQGVASYIVLNVVYAPPGSASGAQSGSVTYSSGLTAGTTIGATSSFKVDNELSASFKAGFLGNGGGISASFDTSTNESNSQEIDVKRSSTYSLTVNTAKTDGINHGQDQITLLLRPTINLALTLTTAKWYPTFDGSHVIILTVAQLQNPQTIGPGDLAELQSAGITPADYPAILAHDPLASGGPIDPNRFVSYGGYPYDPGPLDSQTQTLTYTSSDTNKTETTETYKVGLTITTGAGFSVFGSTTLKDVATWQWTNSSSQAVTAGSTQTAAFTLVNPSTTWGGNTWVQVYFDRIYNTFAFDLVPPTSLTLLAQGKVVATGGVPAQHQEITVIKNGKQFKTWSNNKGEYSLYLPGKDVLSVGKVSQTLSNAVIQPTLNVP